MIKFILGFIVGELSGILLTALVIVNRGENIDNE